MKGCRKLTNEELTRLREEIVKTKHPERDALMLEVGLRTGMRITEILSIRWGDVWDKESNQAKDELYLEKKNTKGKVQGRRMPLHESVRVCLARLRVCLQAQLDARQPMSAEEALYVWLPNEGKLPTMNDDDPVFASDKDPDFPIGRKQGWEVITRAFERAGIKGKVGTHSMRKTFAWSMYQAFNKDLIKTQKALGHKRFNSTVEYIPVDEDEINDAILNAS